MHPCICPARSKHAQSVNTSSHLAKPQLKISRTHMVKDSSGLSYGTKCEASATVANVKLPYVLKVPALTCFLPDLECHGAREAF